MKNLNREKYIFNVMHNYDEKSEFLNLLLSMYFKKSNFKNYNFIEYKTDVYSIIKAMKKIDSYFKFFKTFDYHNIRKYLKEFSEKNIITINSGLMFDESFSYSIDKQILEIYSKCLCLTFVN